MLNITRIQLCYFHVHSNVNAFLKLNLDWWKVIIFKSIVYNYVKEITSPKWKTYINTFLLNDNFQIYFYVSP